MPSVCTHAHRSTICAGVKIRDAKSADGCGRRGRGEGGEGEGKEERERGRRRGRGEGGEVVGMERGGEVGGACVLTCEGKYLFKYLSCSLVY